MAKPFPQASEPDRRFRADSDGMRCARSHHRRRSSARPERHLLSQRTRIRSSRRAASTTGSAATAWCTRSRSHDGRVSYRNRWARTVKWKTEHEAGEALFAAFNPMDSDPSVQVMQTDGIANTNIVWHARQAARARRRSRAVRDGSEDARIDRRLDVRRQTRRADDRAPEDRPRNRRDGLLRLQRAGSISADMSFHVVDRNGKLTRSETFHRAVRGDGARLHGDARSRDLSDHAANGFDGARDARRAGVCVGAGDGHAYRHHAAQRHASRICAGSKAIRRTSSIR